MAKAHRTVIDQPITANPKEGRRRAILVLGVHRSGTSALTRILSLCGAGLPTNLMVETGNNPLGFFESATVFQLHEQLLSEVGSSWDDLSPLAAGWLRSGLAQNYVAEMANLVESEFRSEPLLVLKDPRLCRLVPFWIAVLERLDIDPAFVLPIRNPLEVATSLREAEGVDLQKGLLIWLSNIFQAEHDSRPYIRSFVNYESLLRDWRSVVNKISADLDLMFPRLSRRAAAEADAFLDARLRHHTVTPAEFSAREDVLEWTKVTFDWMELAASGKKLPTQEIDQLHLAFNEAQRAFGPILAQTQLARETADAAVQELRTKVSDLSTERAQIQARLVPLNDESQQLRSRLEQREGQVGELIDCVKLMLVWIATRGPSSKTSHEELQVLLQAMDAAESDSISETAMEGLRRYQESIESSAFAEGATPRRVGLANPPTAPFIESGPENDSRVSEALSELKSRNQILENEKKNQKDRIHFLHDQVEEKQQLLVQALDEFAQSEKRYDVRVSDYHVLEQKLEGAETTADALRKGLRESEQLISGERDRSVSLESTLEDEQSAASQLLATKVELEQQLGHLFESVSTLEARVHEHDALAADSLRKLERRGSDLVVLRAQAEHLTADRLRVREVLSARDREIASMENSRSWRMTLPLRHLGSLARKARLGIVLRPFAHLIGLRK